jgi:hypothetical protein
MPTMPHGTRAKHSSKSTEIKDNEADSVQRASHVLQA